MFPQPDNQFFREYNLIEARKSYRVRTPANHQNQALSRLSAWFENTQIAPSGGLLVLPTGGGKTFTAMRFLCTAPLSTGYRVLWLAHTHHLLEQALENLERELGGIAEPKPKLSARVISGTPGHSRVHQLKPTDDVVIGTLQTFTQAWRNQHPQFTAFLQAAGERLCVVFDEAHHSPAYSYRTLIDELRQRLPKLVLLGLTATPTHSEEKKRGWLTRLFPQQIVYQTTPQELMAAGILAKPIFEDFQTNFETEFDEREYEKWRGTYRDLPEDVITQLAQSRERNLYIANTYVNNRERYGKTIMFADRWFQCEQLREFLCERGVRADAVYTHVDVNPGNPEARNRRTADENKQVLAAFKNDELDVLLNVRMLTEGTDVPDVRTVFLTRQTTSSILLTQMIGRALRGPKFGGTDEAFIVSFTDNWKHLINWANYQQLNAGRADESKPEHAQRPPLQYISIDLVRRLARQMDSGENVAPAPFLSLLPVGWYLIEFETVVAGSDDQVTVPQMMMVFDNEVESYRQLLELLECMDLRNFASPDTTFEAHQEELEFWRQKYFAQVSERSAADLLTNLFHLARHLAQNNSLPRFFAFAERNHHDLDELVNHSVQADLGARKKHEALLAEYSRADRYWRVLYPNYPLFKSQYDACENKLLCQEFMQPAATVPVKFPEKQFLREPSAEVKEQTKARDGFRCLSCGESNRRLLEVDHVAPSYLGGTSALGNLQTLCRLCNNHKAGINEINFRNNHTLLAQLPQTFFRFELPAVDGANDPAEWEKLLRRSLNFFYRCGAVDYVMIGKKGQYFYKWEIYLYDGNDPEWLEPYLKELLQRIRQRRTEAGRQGPDSMVIKAPDKEPITVQCD